MRGSVLWETGWRTTNITDVHVLILHSNYSEVWTRFHRVGPWAENLCCIEKDIGQLLTHDDLMMCQLLTFSYQSLISWCLMTQNSTRPSYEGRDDEDSYSPLGDGSRFRQWSARSPINAGKGIFFFRCRPPMAAGCMVGTFPVPMLTAWNFLSRAGRIRVAKSDLTSFQFNWYFAFLLCILLCITLLHL